MTKMKTILVVTDFSITSRNAAIYGTGLARISEAKLLLYYISGNFPENEHELSPSLKDETIQKKLKTEADQLSQLSNVQVKLLKKSNSVEGIILLEKEGDIDLVIIGIKSLEPLSDLIFKDEMRDLIRKTHVPIIIVPEESSFKKLKKIAFAIDFKLEEALSMHPSIKALLNLSSPEIIVLNVVKENTDISPNKKVSENNIERYFGNRPHIYSFIENNDVVKGLKEFIAINNVDMITMLPHKHNLLGKLLAESKTRKMAFHTTIPLLLLPEG
jgi:nucleotide-binding universal stress UspA family protein